MIEATYPLPKHIDELPDLPFRHKGDWSSGGFWGRLQQVGILAGRYGVIVGVALLWALQLDSWWAHLIVLALGFAPWTAHKFLTRYHTVMGGRVWSPPGTNLKAAKKRIGPHEGMHAWHDEHVPFYKLKFMFPLPIWRRQAEGSAYALDVVQGRRTLQQAAESFSDPIYWQFISAKKAELLIRGYVGRIRAEVGGVDDLT